MLETLDYTIRIGSTPTFLYFDLYLYYTPEVEQMLDLTSIAFTWSTYDQNIYVN